MKRLRSKSLWRLLPLNSQGNPIFKSFVEIGEWYWKDGKLRAVMDPKTARWLYKRKRPACCESLRLQHPTDAEMYIDVPIDAPWNGAYRVPRPATLRRGDTLEVNHIETEAIFAPLILEA